MRGTTWFGSQQIDHGLVGFEGARMELENLQMQPPRCGDVTTLMRRASCLE
jgi:hypothetical protein